MFSKCCHCASYFHVFFPKDRVISVTYCYSVDKLDSVRNIVSQGNVGCHILCLRPSISVVQNNVLNTTAKSRHRHDMISDV